MLRCNVCRHKIHLQCTQLPPYQLFHFLYTKNYRRYVCAGCTDQIGQLPNHIMDNIAHTAQIEQNKIETLEETLHLKDKELYKRVTQHENKSSRTRKASGNPKEACKRSRGNNRTQEPNDTKLKI